MKKLLLLLVALLTFESAKSVVTVTKDEVQRMNIQYKNLVYQHQECIRKKQISFYTGLGFGVISSFAAIRAVNSSNEKEINQNATISTMAGLGLLISSICYVVYEFKADDLQIQINTCGVRVNF